MDLIRKIKRSRLSVEVLYLVDMLNNDDNLDFDYYVWGDKHKYVLFKINVETKDILYHHLDIHVSFQVNLKRNNNRILEFDELSIAIKNSKYSEYKIYLDI